MNMPVPWVAISAALFLTPTQGVPASTQGGVRQVYGDLVIEAKSATFTEEVVTFRDGVTATFSGEVLTADSLILRPKDQTGEATGHVILRDPAGYLSAENLKFSWKPELRSGSASNVHLELAGVMMDAERAETIPGDTPTYVFTNVVGTSCGREKTPLYSIHSRRVEFHPGSQGIIRHPTVYLFGRKIATLPTHKFSLNPRVKGIPLPGFVLNDKNIGVQWSPSMLIDNNTTANISVRSFKGELIKATAYVTRSNLQEQDIHSVISPRSDFIERFANNYFDSVHVGSPDSADLNLREKRENISVGTAWNRQSFNDPGRSNYSKLLEVVFEKGGELSKELGYQYSIRGQDMRIEDDPFKPRVTLQATVGPKPIPLGMNLHLITVLDVATFQGSTSFSWARGEAGIYFHPKKWLTIGAAYAHGSEFGNALYPADRLLIRDEAMGRIDLDFGPTKLSLLEKKDFDRDRSYREYKVSQIIGCLEASILSREFPHSYHLGVALRLDDFLDILRTRKVQFGSASKATPTTAPPMNHAVHP